MHKKIQLPCYVIISLLILILTSCKDQIINSGDNNDEIIVSVFPDIGTIKTGFEFSVALIIDKGDTLTNPERYKVRWDWENDGIYDTGWLDSLNIKHTYSSYGKKVVKVAIRDSSGNIDSTISRVYVQELVQITENHSGSGQGNIDWSRDGTNRIAFDWRPGGGEHQIYIVQYPDGIPQQITFDSTGLKCRQFAEWSPDGTKIAFVSTAVKYIDLKTNVIHTIINEPRYPFAWSPNGNFLLSRLGEIYSYNFITGSDSVIIDHAHGFCWSPDSRLIGFVNGRNDLISFIDYKTGDIIKEYEIPDAGFKIDWSPDGKWISLGFTSGILNILNYETGRIYSIKIVGLDRRWYPSWSEDGNLIAFEAREVNSERQIEIWAIRFPDDLE